MTNKFKEFLLKIYKSFRRSEAPFEHLANVAIATQSGVALDKRQAAIYTTGLFSLNMIDTGVNTNTNKLEETIVSKIFTEEAVSISNPCLVDSKHVVDDESILQGVVNLEADNIKIESNFISESIETNIDQVDKEIPEEVIGTPDAIGIEEEEPEILPQSDFANEIFASKTKEEIVPELENITPIEAELTSNIMWEEIEEVAIVKKGKKAKKEGKKKKKQVSKSKEKTLKKKKKSKKKVAKNKEELSNKNKKRKSKVKNKSKKTKSLKKNRNTVGLTSFGNYQPSEFTSWVYKLQPLEDGFFNKKVSKSNSSKKKKKKKHKAVKASALKSITLKEDIATETLVNILIIQGHKDKAIDMIDKLIVQHPNDAVRLTLVQESLRGQ